MRARQVKKPRGGKLNRPHPAARGRYFSARAGPPNAAVKIVYVCPTGAHRLLEFSVDYSLATSWPSAHGETCRPLRSDGRCVERARPSVNLDRQDRKSVV